MRKIPPDISSHNSVPAESSWVLDLVENQARVVDSKNARACGEGQKATCSEQIVNESGNSHLSVDLEEIFCVLAFRKAFFENGKVYGDAWISAND